MAKSAGCSRVLTPEGDPDSIVEPPDHPLPVTVCHTVRGHKQDSMAPANITSGGLEHNRGKSGVRKNLV